MTILSTDIWSIGQRYGKLITHIDFMGWISANSRDKHMRRLHPVISIGYLPGMWGTHINETLDIEYIGQQ
jgi:hypothetical protein